MMLRPIQRRKLAREARQMLPAETRERLASAGFLLVEGYLARLLQEHLEDMMQELIQHPTSRLTKKFQAKAAHSLALLDAMKEES